MAVAHFVKRSRKAYKDNGIKKGESYWWWSFRFGGKHRSKTRPRPSQLTQSDFTSRVLGAEESLGDLAEEMSGDDLQAEVENIVSELESLKDETDDHFNNMPEGLQQGDTGQLLESRVASVEQFIDEIQGVDLEGEKTDVFAELHGLSYSGD